MQCPSHTAPRVGKLRGLSRLRFALSPVRLPDRPRQLPLLSLSAEAEGGYLCCSRTSAMPSSPSKKASRTTWVNGLPTIPTAAYLAAENISPTTGPGREGKKRCAGAVMVWYASECAMKYGGDPPQPTSNHRSKGNDEVHDGTKVSRLSAHQGRPCLQHSGFDRSGRALRVGQTKHVGNGESDSVGNLGKDSSSNSARFLRLCFVVF